jgi:ribosomal protein S18 acetylase RimI-like enzyme
MNIRIAQRSDIPFLWGILREVAEGGDTIPTCASATEAAMVSQWFSASVMSYVAVDEDAIVGMYKLGANQPDLGSHVSTATFMVRSSHRGKGVGTALVEHCLSQASAAGFLSIQFNFVVSSNAAALSLYKRLGFSIAGTLPAAFRHRTLGYIDAYVLTKVVEPAGVHSFHLEDSSSKVTPASGRLLFKP